MKFSINQSELQNALSVVLKGIATRSTLPILSGIYLDAHDDTLTLQATDLELSIQYSVSALIEETGKAVVPGKLFSEIVKNLPDAAVHVAAEDDSAVITCDTASFSIKTLDAEDFPGFPHVDVQQEVSIPFTQFASMVKRVARVVSKDESRAILTGVLITLEDTTLKMVATDSYRLAITEAELPESSAEEFQAVIAGSFLQEISSLPRSEDDLKLALAENQIVVTYHDTVFINRRLEGNFPNYRQLLPDSYATRVSMDVGHLVAAAGTDQLAGALRHQHGVADRAAVRRGAGRGFGPGDAVVRGRRRGRGDRFQLRLRVGRAVLGEHRQRVPRSAVVHEARHLQS